MTTDQFWESSLRETFQAIDGFLFREELIQERQVTSAWLQANWQRAKRMPNLRTILNKIKRGRTKPQKSVQQSEQDFEKMVDEMTGDLPIKTEE